MEEGFGIFHEKKLIMFFGSWAAESTVRSIAYGYMEKGVLSSCRQFGTCQNPCQNSAGET